MKNSKNHNSLNALCLHDDDNIIIAINNINSGEYLNEFGLKIDSPSISGQKIARYDIKKNSPILKYGTIIGFADTHGHLNLHKDVKRYEHFFKRIKDSDKNTCFHLHNHTGKAYMNYIMCLESPYVDFCDTSVMSLGKGAGNLKLENVLDDDKALKLNEFIHKYYESLFKKTVSPYLCGLNLVLGVVMLAHIAFPFTYSYIIYTP